ncbi:hypothetical protein IV203_021412 [Nitzschia inconspicua]|uniref:Uncharacterized protein n=1 Tax=Nitzschia inconspicua TaxID=303405 RepID=A0A9K3PD96_9STRA|nr:hypothetical protein IV203_021412 [Nitzschia inconspicua]
MPLLGIGKKKKAVDSAAETAPANVTSPPPTEAKPVPSVRKKKTKESSAKSKDVNNTPTANPKAAVTKKNKPKKTKKGSKDTTTATASSGQKGPPKKNTTAKKPPLTSSCEAPMGKFQEQDWKTDIEDEQMGNMDDAALSSPSKADLEDDIDEDDWDTESDDTDDERMKHTPPTSKQSPRLHDVAVGAAVGAATIGAAAVGLPAIATDDDDDEEEEDDDDDDDDDEYKRHEEYDKTNQETKEDNIMEDEGDNESTASYESNDSYETENDDSNRTQNQAAFMSPATVQKQTAMSTPFSPLPSTTHHVLETNSIPFFGREKEMKQLDQVRERVTGKRVIDGIKVLENKPEVVLVSGSELGVGTSYFIKEAFYSPSRQTSPDSVYGKCISCRGICEANAGLSSAPLQVFSDLLNDLVVKLILPGRTGGKVIWKDRMNEALGGEGPLLATLVPKIGVLMDLPGFGNDPREIRPPLSGPTTSQTKNSPDKNQPIQNQQQLPPNPGCNSSHNGTGIPPGDFFAFVWPSET